MSVWIISEPNRYCEGFSTANCFRTRVIVNSAYTVPYVTVFVSLVLAVPFAKKMYLTSTTTLDERICYKLLAGDK